MEGGTVSDRFRILWVRWLYSVYISITLVIHTESTFSALSIVATLYSSLLMWWSFEGHPQEGTRLNPTSQLKPNPEQLTICSTLALRHSSTKGRK